MIKNEFLKLNNVSLDHYLKITDIFFEYAWLISLRRTQKMEKFLI